MSRFTDYPLGIRPWSSELAAKEDPQEEGYTYALLGHSNDAYRITAFCGATKVAGIFQAFLDSLPGEAFFILEFYQELAAASESGEEDRPAPKVYYSPYLPTSELLQAIGPYFERLVHDGFVGFGFANNRAGMELFYSEEKVLTGFTGNHLRFMDLLARKGVPYRPQMTFPSDAGHDHLSLLCHERHELPPSLANYSDDELDYVHFCDELTELLDMYPVEETLSFFLTEKEQDQVETLYRGSTEFAEFADEDFGTLLLDWHDFVTECEEGFHGDLWEYQQGLRLRDAIEFVARHVVSPLKEKIGDIIGESDSAFQKLLVDQRKRLHGPDPSHEGDDKRFWYHGVVRNQGVDLRRDLIRQGWFKP